MAAVTAHASAFGPGLSAGKPADCLASFSASLRGFAGAAPGRNLPHLDRQHQGPQPCRGFSTHCTAHPRSLQRNLFRTRLPGPLFGPEPGARQRPDGARRKALPENIARPAARARLAQAGGRRLAGPVGNARRLHVGRARLAASAALRQRAGGQHAGLGLSGVERASGLHAGTGARPAGRRTATARHPQLVVWRSRCAARRAAAHQPVRDQTHLPLQHRPPKLRTRARPHPVAPRAGRMGGPHPA